MQAERRQADARRALDPGGGRTRRRFLDVAGFALLTLVLALSHVVLSKPAAGAALDPSWQQSLGVALRENLRFGVDLQFTYGPLGYFFDSPYDARLYWIDCLGWELGFKLLAAGFAVACLGRIEGRLARSIVAFLLIVPLAGQDAWAFAVVACVTAWFFAKPERSPALEAVGTFVLAVLSLVKFTWFLLAMVAVVCFAWTCWRERGVRRALRPPARFAVFLFLLWICAGQAPSDLPRWIASSIGIASGFSAAMGRSGSARELAAALALVLAVAACLVLGLRRTRGPRSIGFAAFALAAAFLGFKAGFVRNYGNSITTFAFLPLLPFLARIAGRNGPPSASPHAATPPRPTRIEIAVLACVLGLATYGFGAARQLGVDGPLKVVREWSVHLASNAKHLLDARGMQLDLERESAEVARRVALPRVRAMVGDAPIDLVSQAQGVLHANGLAWRPRPVFQSYVAYTAELARRNAAFFESERAPRFVLLHVESIDRHLPGMEDAPTLQVLSRDYDALFAESIDDPTDPIDAERARFLLLERRVVARHGGEPASARAIELERTAGFDEWIDLGATAGRCRLLSVDIQPSWIGRALTVAFRAVPVWMDVEDSDGRSGSYRVLPDLLREGVFLRPFAVDDRDWERWFLEGDGARLTRVRVTARDPSRDRFFEPVIRVRVERAEDLVPRERVGDVLERR